MRLPAAGRAHACNEIYNRKAFGIGTGNVIQVLFKHFLKMAVMILWLHQGSPGPLQRLLMKDLEWPTYE